MAGPMQGVRVVELGFWVAGPSAAGILADWGADVVKLEPPDGDPFRALYLALVGQAMPINPPFELDNRGKRSIALDLTRPEGRELAYRLIDGADVLVSNFRPEILERFGLDYPTLSRRNPRLVYASDRLRPGRSGSRSPRVRRRRVLVARGDRSGAHDAGR